MYVQTKDGQRQFRFELETDHQKANACDLMIDITNNPSDGNYDLEPAGGVSGNPVLLVYLPESLTNGCVYDAVSEYLPKEQVEA